MDSFAIRRLDQCPSTLDLLAATKRLRGAWKASLCLEFSGQKRGSFQSNLKPNTLWILNLLTSSHGSSNANTLCTGFWRPTHHHLKAWEHQPPCVDGSVMNGVWSGLVGGNFHIKWSHVADVPVTHLLYNLLSFLFSRQRLENRETNLSLKWLMRVNQVALSQVLHHGDESIGSRSAGSRSAKCPCHDRLYQALAKPCKTILPYRTIGMHLHEIIWDHSWSAGSLQMPNYWLCNSTQALSEQILKIFLYEPSVFIILINGPMDVRLQQLAMANSKWKQLETRHVVQRSCEPGVDWNWHFNISNGFQRFLWAVDTKACREQKQMELRGVDLCKTNCLQTTKIVCFIPIRPLPLKLYQ